MSSLRLSLEAVIENLSARQPEVSDVRPALTSQEKSLQKTGCVHNPPVPYHLQMLPVQLSENLKCPHV